MPSRSALTTGRHPIRTGCITALPGSGLVAWEGGEDVGRLPTDKGFDYW
jgi:arylsulfatase A-like enzyme